MLKEVKIEVTSRCPLSCVHCSSDAGPLNDIEIASEKCCSIIKEAADLGVEEIAFSGGEPLVWAPLSDCVSYASSLIDCVAIYTTGNVESSGDKLKLLKENGLSRAVFSIFSASALDHERITRKRGSFERTLKAISFCNDFGVETGIHFVATSDNYYELESVCQVAAKYDVEQISVLRFVPQGRGRLLQGALDSKQSRELRSKIIELRERGYNIRTGSPMNVFWVNDNPQCMAAQDRAIISPSLDIFPCDAFKQVRAVDIVGTAEFSNLRNHSLSDCWHQSPYFKRIREAVKLSPAGECAGCAALAKCGTGCLAQKYLQHGSLEQRQDPGCLKDLHE